MGFDGLEKIQCLRMKPNVLIFIDWFFPGFKAGGPIQSVTNLVNLLGNEFDFSIVTSDKDLGDVVSYPNVKQNVWANNGGYRVLYLDKANQNKRRYEEILNENKYEFIYFNSLFSLKFTLLPLWSARKTKSNILLAPRGMLGAGALTIKKRKKQLFLRLFKLTGVGNKITWHATAESEVLEIKKHFGNQVKILVAPNLSARITSTFQPKEKQINQLRLFFLSRIAEKKNLKGALGFLSTLDFTYHIDFTFIGPIDEEKYWLECVKIIDQIPSNININHLGSIPNQELSKFLKDQHFLLLPTLNENFGHVIMESWQNGCPVIISDQTPWRDLEEKGIGWDIPLSKPDQFVQALETAAAMDQETYDKMSQAAFEFAKQFTENPEVLVANRNLFRL